MCNFPAIQYDPNFEGLRNQKIPQSTYTYLKKNGIVVDDHFLDGIPNMKKLEEYINKKIQSYNGNDDNTLYDIFRLIHIWGGDWGKVVFWNNIPFEEKWENGIKKQYILLVKTCMGVMVDKEAPLNIKKNNIDTVFNAVQTIKDNVCGLDVSFITKHTRFWLQKNNKENPLPIFDNIIAKGLFNNKAKITLLKQYWNCMIYKALSLNNGMSLLALERQLFNYFNDKKKEDTKAVEGASEKEPTLRQCEIILPDKNRNDRPLKWKWVTLNGEPFLLFAAERPNECYFCQLCYKYEDDVEKRNSFDINTLSDVQMILERFNKAHWYPRNTRARKTYKYVKYSGDNAKTDAITLYDDILSFIEKL